MGERERGCIFYYTSHGNSTFIDSNENLKWFKFCRIAGGNKLRYRVRYCESVGSLKDISITALNALVSGVKFLTINAWQIKRIEKHIKRVMLWQKKNYKTRAE